MTELGLDAPVVGPAARRLAGAPRAPAHPPGRGRLARPGLAGAGAVLVSDEPKALEQEADGGPVRWELGEGTGHGARLTVTWTGPDAAARDAAAAEAPARARSLARWPIDAVRGAEREAIPFRPSGIAPTGRAGRETDVIGVLLGFGPSPAPRRDGRQRRPSRTGR